MSFNEVDRAQVLAEALPYIQKYYGKTIVVKYGGNAMISDELRQAVISDIILLHLVGLRVVVVHGGGPEISEMLKKTGKESRFVDGLPFDEDAAKRILSEKEVVILVDLHEGDEAAECWGCDLTYDYVKINGDYRT